MANLTLSIDDDLLQRAREAALRERTSVNALVREYLERNLGAQSGTPMKSTAGREPPCVKRHGFNQLDT